MKRRAYIVGAILLVVSASVWGFLRAQSRKTEYAGRGLTSWLEIARNPGMQTEAISAIQPIGTNALPTLLQWVEAKDPPWKNKLITYLAAHPQIPYPIYSAQDKFIFAADAFQYLGSNAAPALPDLMDFFKKGDDFAKFRVASVLAAMGPIARPAKPILINYLQTQQPGPSWAVPKKTGLCSIIISVLNNIDPNFAESENGK
jgi:hypothetical protein